MKDIQPNDFTRGYEANLAGHPFDEAQSTDWRDGWQEADILRSEWEELQYEAGE